MHRRRHRHRVAHGRHWVRLRGCRPVVRELRVDAVDRRAVQRAARRGVRQSLRQRQLRASRVIVANEPVVVPRCVVVGAIGDLRGTSGRRVPRRPLRPPAEHVSPHPSRSRCPDARRCAHLAPCVPLIEVGARQRAAVGAARAPAPRVREPRPRQERVVRPHERVHVQQQRRVPARALGLSICRMRAPYGTCNAHASPVRRRSAGTSGTAASAREKLTLRGVESWARSSRPGAHAPQPRLSGQAAPPPPPPPPPPPRAHRDSRGRTQTCPARGWAAQGPRPAWRATRAT